jgi:hypothetical protein
MLQAFVVVVPMLVVNLHQKLAFVQLVVFLYLHFVSSDLQFVVSAK